MFSQSQEEVKLEWMYKVSVTIVDSYKIPNMFL